MRREWLIGIGSMAVGLVLWFIGWQFDVAGWLPVSLFLGTIVPASFVVIDLSRRLMPTIIAKGVSIVIGLIDLVVVAAIAMLHAMETAETFAFLGTTTIAIWGTVTLGIGLTLALLILSLQLTMSYMRVASGRTKAIGAILIGVGGIGLVLPLQFIDLTDAWPLVALPAMIVAVMGQRRLDQ